MERGSGGWCNRLVLGIACAPRRGDVALESGGEAQKLMPTAIRVGPNYPNPFNPQTIIPIELPKMMDVKIIIYDILGRTIKTLYDGIMESGGHYIRWNGRDEQQRKLASGVYLYRIEISVARKTVSGKIMLVQ